LHLRRINFCTFFLVFIAFSPFRELVAQAESHQIFIPNVWMELLASGRSLEVSGDPTFTKIFFAIESDLNREISDFNSFPSLTLPLIDDKEVLFWRMRDRKHQVRLHPGLFVIVPAGSEAIWIDFGVDATPSSRWEIRASEIPAKKPAHGTVEKTFFFSGSSVLLTGQGKPWVYRILPAAGNPLIKKIDGQFIGMRIARASSGGGKAWQATSSLYPKGVEEVPEFVGPFGAIIDSREPTRETVSSVRFLGKYLSEDLSIKRELEFNVSGARSIGGAIRIEDVSFYPASIFADFEWHGVQANYEGSPSGEPPGIIKHVFGGIGIGYDFAKFLPNVEQKDIAVHIGPQLSIVSVPVTTDFEPKGFVGLRIQPQLIRLGSVWYGNFQVASRADGNMSQFAMGYMNCRFQEICLSAETYRRNLNTKSGTNETSLKETGVALGVGANL
jgi:hypothetical protein